MSILQSHHVIEQSVFSKNDLLQVLVAGGFDRDGSKNRIYLPVDNDLAEEVGSSPHRGRTLSSYNLMSMSLVESIMDTAAGKLVMSGDSDPDALHQVAHKVNELQDTLKVALINGDVFASRPAHMSKDQANMHNRQFFANIDQYRIEHSEHSEHSEQLEALRGMRPIESEWAAITHSEERINKLLSQAEDGNIKLVRARGDEGVDRVAGRMEFQMAVTQAQEGGALAVEPGQPGKNQPDIGG